MKAFAFSCLFSLTFSLVSFAQAESDGPGNFTSNKTFSSLFKRKILATPLTQQEVKIENKLRAQLDPKHESSDALWEVVARSYAKGDSVYLGREQYCVVMVAKDQSYIGTIRKSGTFAFGDVVKIEENENGSIGYETRPEFHPNFGKTEVYLSVKGNKAFFKLVGGADHDLKCPDATLIELK